MYGNGLANTTLLKKICESGESMTIHYNSGNTSINLIGKLPGYGTVLYHPNGIANILSLSIVKERYKVTFDSTQTNRFIVYKDWCQQMSLWVIKKWLYYLDAKTYKNTAERSFVNKVRDNKTEYSVREYKTAEYVRQLYRTIGCPSIPDFTNFGWK